MSLTSLSLDMHSTDHTWGRVYEHVDDNFLLKFNLIMRLSQNNNNTDAHKLFTVWQQL